jgi:predicted nucleic acid-binding protein
MRGRAFLDTNILIYAFAENDARLDAAERIVNEGGVVSVQVLNELAHTLRRKFRIAWTRVGEIIETILSTCPDPLPLSLETHRAALRICERYGFSIYDGLVIAAALEAGCSVLYTEDLQHGQIIGGVKIVNPFL